MAYTVKELSVLSGVTVRTLHFYEEAELLMPAYYGSNRSDFDKLAALHSHKKALSHEWDKIGHLIKTIDKTIKHLKGEKKMKEKEIFDGFALVTRGKGTESYFDAETLVLESVRDPTQKREKVFHKSIAQKAHGIFRELVSCMERGLSSTSDEVQRIIKKHHALTDEIKKASKEVYKALAQLYHEHPTFRKQLDPFHPKLAQFMSQAMTAYAERRLK